MRWAQMQPRASMTSFTRAGVKPSGSAASNLYFIRRRPRIDDGASLRRMQLIVAFDPFSDKPLESFHVGADRLIAGGDLALEPNLQHRDLTAAVLFARRPDTLLASSHGKGAPPDALAVGCVADRGPSRSGRMHAVSMGPAQQILRRDTLSHRVRGHSREDQVSPVALHFDVEHQVAQ